MYELREVFSLAHDAQGLTSMAWGLPTDPAMARPYLEIGRNLPTHRQGHKGPPGLTAKNKYRVILKRVGSRLVERPQVL